MNIKTNEEIEIMRAGGQKLGIILDTLLEKATPGMKLIAIEDLAQKLIKKAGGTPSFQTVGDYKWATCLCVNESVVHGIPTDYVLVEGDILTIDVGLLYKGFHTDTAWTKIVGEKVVDEEVLSFLGAGEKALWAAIAQARKGNHIGHISQEIEVGVESGGYSVVPSLVGHGIGKVLHDEPQIPGIVTKQVTKTPQLQAGLTIAIEVIYAQGKGEVANTNKDGWTLATKDGSMTAVYEHTILVTEEDPEILTAGRSG